MRKNDIFTIGPIILFIIFMFFSLIVTFTPTIEEKIYGLQTNNYEKTLASNYLTKTDVTSIRKYLENGFYDKPINFLIEYEKIENKKQNRFGSEFNQHKLFEEKFLIYLKGENEKIKQICNEIKLTTSGCDKITYNEKIQPNPRRMIIEIN